jgi:hypothetical protein
MENLREYKDFKGLKKGSSLISENVMPNGDSYDVTKSIELPKSVVKAYIKKIKDESGKNAAEFFAETTIAEKMIDYIISTYLNVENLPSSVLFGDYMNTQTQPVQNAPGQPQAQPAQTQVQGGDNVQADATAEQIPATQTQPQGGQPQGGQPQGGQPATQQTQGGTQEI